MLTVLFLAGSVVFGGALHFDGALADTNSQSKDIRLNKSTHIVSPLDMKSKLEVLWSESVREPIAWSIAPNSVADIDPNTGVITPKVESGRAVITATGTVTGRTAKCALVVRAAAVKAIKLNAKNLTIAPGQQFHFRGTIEPLDAAQGDIAWSVSSLNPPAQGKGSRFDAETLTLTAGSVEGETLMITASAGGKIATARVMVKAANVSAVKFKKGAYAVGIGKTCDLGKQLVVLPTRASDTSVTWQSSNEQVATVDASGMVTVLDDGTAKITATSNENPAKSGSCTVRGVAVRVKSIALSASSAVGDPGDAFSVTAKVAPASATFTDVIWSSSDEAVASADQNGHITIRAPGKAIITASTDKGKKSAKLVVRCRGGNMQTIKISAVGDVVLGGDKKKVKRADGLNADRMSSYARFRALYDQYGPGYFFGGVSDIFNNDDLTVVNYECTLTNSKARLDKTFHFQGDPVFAQMLRPAGVDVACLANNHSMDFGAKGYSDTKKHLKSVGVTPYGIGSAATTVVNANGVRVGFAGFRTPTSRSNVAKAIRDLKRRDKCQVVIVSFHWTNSREWTDKITGEERSNARFAINRGADLVIGHHKHALSGIERYKGKMIAYDVGNFIALIRNQVTKNTYTDKDTMIYQQRFNIFEDGYVECTVPNIIPCVGSDSPEIMTANPRPATGEDVERILQKVLKRTPSKDQGLVKTISGY